MENFHSSASAAGISLILRSSVRVLSKKMSFATCWVIDEPPCTVSPALRLTSERARRALQVDAEVPVEAPVLGGDDGVDEVRRDVLGPGHPELLAAPGEGLAVGVDERHRAALARVEQVVEVGQLAHVPGRARGEHERGEHRRPPADPPENAQQLRENDAAHHALPEARAWPGPYTSLACLGHGPRSFCSLFCRPCYAEVRRSASALNPRAADESVRELPR